jgi:hypothetical protein
MNNNPIGCGALLVLRYIWRNQFLGFPSEPSLWEAARIAKTLDPLQPPDHSGMYPVFYAQQFR